MSPCTRTLIRLAAFVAVIVSTSGLSHARGFLPAVNYFAGTEPLSVAVGDFNGDGKLDLAVLHAGNDGFGQVRILLGEGDGTFHRTKTLIVGLGPAFIAAADFNEDGMLDLVVANANGNTVSVLLNSPAGFLPPVAYASGGYGPESLVVEDFDGDGSLDLVVANRCADGTCIGPGVAAFLKGDGHGSFSLTGTYEAGPQLTSVAAGDFNRDGNLDLAVAADANDGVFVLLGKGDGSFQPAMHFAGSLSVLSVAVGDFDSDGKLDLVIATSSETLVGILLGNGDGTFQPPALYGVGKHPHSVAAADFNGDGALDVAVALDAGGVGVMFGQGDGTFPVIRHFAEDEAYWFVAVGDFNHDRAADLSVLSLGGNNLSVLMNSGGTFVTATSSQDPAPVGGSVTFTASVAPSLVTTIPTGKVTFADGATILATVPLDPTGHASFTTSSLSLGTHSIRTKYSGDPNFNPNTGKAITQIIQ